MDMDDSRQTLQIGCYVIYGVAISAVFEAVLPCIFISICGLGRYAHNSGYILVTVPFQFNLCIGLQITTLTNHEILYGRKAAWISQKNYFLAFGFIKCSIVALYLRLASKSIHRKILWGLETVIMVQGIVTSVVLTHMCNPVSVIWSNSFSKGCIELLKFSYCNTAFHILTDILLAILPIPVLVELQLSRRRKLALAIPFGVGIITIAATFTRQLLLGKALHGTDFSWAWAPTEFVTNLEINLGIICASVPAFQSFRKSVWGAPSSIDSNQSQYPSTRLSQSGTKNGFRWHSKGKSMSESVTEISRKVTAGSASEDEIIIQSTNRLEIYRKREAWEKDGDGLSRVGRVKTTISRGSKTDEEIIQLRALGASSRDGVLKSVELRVDYESR